jgi:xanthine dehydrogenase accessory factor
MTIGQAAGSTARDSANDAVAFYARLTELLSRGERLALCTLLRLTGSGPRGAGSKMLVREAGGPVGTVGGGVLERSTTTWGLEVLRSGRALCRSFTLDLQQASDEGMTCGGEVEVLVEPFEGNRSAARDFFDQVLGVLSRRERGWLATTIRRADSGVLAEHFLVVGGRSVAALSASDPSLPEDLLLAPVPAAPALTERGGVRYFLEPLTLPITVYVFGAGHIAASLVPLCDLLGFQSVVVDDRNDFASRERFPRATRLVVVPSFDQAFADPSIGPLGKDSYVVIVTRGHGGDLAVLRQALQCQPGYVGMIGSRRKRQLILDQLSREGFSADDLARVVCPIGLSIGAETPQEIALSIAAQIVATRAGHAGKG